MLPLNLEGPPNTGFLFYDRIPQLLLWQSILLAVSREFSKDLNST